MYIVNSIYKGVVELIYIYIYIYIWYCFFARCPGSLHYPSLWLCIRPASACNVVGRFSVRSRNKRMPTNACPGWRLKTKCTQFVWSDKRLEHIFRRKTIKCIHRTPMFCSFQKVQLLILWNVDDVAKPKFWHVCLCRVNAY